MSVAPGGASACAECAMSRISASATSAPMRRGDPAMARPRQTRRKVEREQSTPAEAQRALRRTFQDFARAAQVNDLVTRSISGHLTERMQHQYSTVNGGEHRAAARRSSSSKPVPTLQVRRLTWERGLRRGERREHKRKKPGQSRAFVEREKGFEPSTSTLARWHSTTELLPQPRQRLVGVDV